MVIHGIFFLFKNKSYNWHRKNILDLILTNRKETVTHVEVGGKLGSTVKLGTKLTIMNILEAKILEMLMSD